MELVADIRAYIEANLDYLPGFLLACEIVVEVTLLTIVLSWVFGLIAALAKSAPYRLIRLPAEFYIWFVRGTPTLIQIFMIYFGLPQLGLRLPHLRLREAFAHVLETQDGFHLVAVELDFDACHE